MKKRAAILFLTGLCAAFMLVGCGTKSDSKDAEKKENKSESSVEYKAQDYVTLGEYKGLSVELTSHEVTDASIKSYVENIISSKPNYEKTDKTDVENGDFVNIDYEGLLDGKAFDGGTDQGYVLEIGSNSFIEGFEEGLIGAKAGESRSLNLTFPEGYQSEELAGKAVVFNVKVNAIVEKKDVSYDSLNDEYVSSNFGYDTVQAFLDSAKKAIQSENQYNEESEMRTAVVAKLKEICSVDSMPEGLLDERVKDYKEQFEKMCKDKYDMEVSDYLKENYQMTEEEFNTQTVEFMKENLQMELILQAIAEKEKLEVDEEGFQSYLKTLMSNYGYEDEKAVYDQYGEDYVKTSYLGNKAMDLVLENTKVNYKDNADTADDGKTGEATPDDGKSDAEKADDGEAGQTDAE